MHVLLLFYIAEGLFCTIPELLNLKTCPESVREQGERGCSVREKLGSSSGPFPTGAVSQGLTHQAGIGVPRHGT